MNQKTHLEDNWDSHWDNFSASASNNPAEYFRFRLVFNILQREKTNASTLIDFGSGTGIFLKELNTRFPNINMIGFEYSKMGVEIAKANVPKGSFFQKNMLEEDDEPIDALNSADYAVCTEVLEHVDNPVLFLKNSRKYLKNGAKLIITVPGGKMSEFDKYLGHRKHFSIKDLSDILLEAGFKKYKVRAAGFPFFNLYKLAIIIRGKHLIEDCKNFEKKKSIGMFGRILGSLFYTMFLFNVNNTPFGWQIIAEVEN